MGYSNSRLRGCVNWKEDGGTACVLREKRKERTQTQKGLFFFLGHLLRRVERWHQYEC